MSYYSALPELLSGYIGKSGISASQIWDICAVSHKLDSGLTSFSLLSAGEDGVWGSVLSLLEKESTEGKGLSQLQKERFILGAILLTDKRGLLQKNGNAGLVLPYKFDMNIMGGTGIIGEEKNAQELYAYYEKIAAVYGINGFEKADAVEELSEAALYEINVYMSKVMTAYKELFGTVHSPLRPKGAYSFAEKEFGLLKYVTDKGNDSKAYDLVCMDRLSVLARAVLGNAVLDEGGFTAVDLGKSGSRYYASDRIGRFATGRVKQGNRLSGEDFDRQVQYWVENKLKEVYKAYKDTGDVHKALDAASKSLVTAFVIAEFDTDVSKLLVLKICVPTVELNMDISVLQNVLSSKFPSTELRSVKCVQGEKTDFPVYTVCAALESVAERKSPVFAYQIWDSIRESGNISEIVGTHNVIFGRKGDGSLLSFNMSELGGNAFHNMSVVAASRSGKGLTTLNTVASAAAHGEPVFYIDCKPDMAQMLWLFMKSKGKYGRVFAYDALGNNNNMPDGRKKALSADPVRYRHYEFPYDFSDVAEFSGQEEAIYGGLIAMKAMSLVFALMNFVVDTVPERGELLGYDFKCGLLAVFDELEKTDAEHMQPLQSFCESKVAKEKAGKGNDAELTERAKYVQNLFGYYKAFKQTLVMADRAMLGKSYISTLSLFQSTKYCTGNTAFFKGVFGTRALVGRVASDATKAVTDGLSAEAKKSLDNRQWYLTKGSVKSLDTSQLDEPVKPFLVFNQPGDVDKYLNGSEFKSLNLPLSFRQELNANKDKLHFTGLLENYGVRLEDSLEKGYMIAEKFLKLTGFEGTVDDYVLSAAEESLITSVELVKRAAGFRGNETPVGSGKRLDTDDDEFGIFDGTESICNSDSAGRPETVNNENKFFSFLLNPAVQSEIFNSDNGNKDYVNVDKQEETFAGGCFKYEEQEIETGAELDISPDEPVPGMQKLVELYTKTVRNWLGVDWKNAKSLAVVSDSLLINNVKIKIKLPEDKVKSVPPYACGAVQSGLTAQLVDWRMLKEMQNLSFLKFDSAEFVYDTVRPSLGYASDMKPSVFFKVCPGLRTLDINGVVLDVNDTKAARAQKDMMFAKASVREEIQRYIENKSWAGAVSCVNGMGSLWRSKKIGLLGKVLATPFLGAGAAASASVSISSKVVRGLFGLGKAIKDGLTENNT